MNLTQMLRMMSYHLHGGKKNNKIHVNVEGPDMGGAMRKSGWNSTKRPKTESSMGPILWDPRHALPSALRTKGRGSKNKTSASSSKSKSNATKHKCVVPSKKKRLEQVFPFEKLPSNCKLIVFSYLNETDKGSAGTVCKEWNTLIKSSSLWDSVNLNTFPLCTKYTQGHNCTHLCYQTYMQRLKGYMAYLCRIRPTVKNLQFELDIGDKDDAWLPCLEQLLLNCQGERLLFAHMNWKETPSKPFWVDGLAWSSREYSEMVQRHKHRQRDFVHFFELFVNVAPNVQKLMVPFDWSFRNIHCLSRLQNLRTLILEKYFVFQALDQSALDELLRSTPNLKQLVLEIWSPSGRGLVLYKMSSQNIEDLDISQSRGFYLRYMNLPAMKSFRLTRHPWNGPLVSPDAINIPCIYKVLKHGAPKLKKLNDLILEDDWTVSSYPKLEELLKTVCSCRRHKPGWSM